MENKTQNFLRWLVHDIFLLSFVGLFILTALEIIVPRLVSNYVNINIVLSVSLIMGVLLLFFPGVENNKALTSYTRWRLFGVWLVMIGVSIAAGYVVFIYATDLGLMAWMLAVLTFLGVLFGTISLNE